MLNFLDIGGAFTVKLGNCSAFYKQGDSLLLIDCGENIFEKIFEHDILKDVKDMI